MWDKILYTHSQTSTVVPLEFGNGCVISSHTFNECNYLSIMQLNSKILPKERHFCFSLHIEDALIIFDKTNFLVLSHDYHNYKSQSIRWLTYTISKASNSWCWSSIFNIIVVSSSWKSGPVMPNIWPCYNGTRPYHSIICIKPKLYLELVLANIFMNIPLHETKSVEHTH